MDTHDHTQILALLPLGALIAFRLYRRFRSHVGPQKVQPRRMTLRVAFLGVVSALLLFSPIGNYARLEMLVAIALGAGLAWYGLRLTSFQHRGADRYYIPNIYIGLALTTLFVLRLVYRVVTVYPQMQQMEQGGVAMARLGPFALPVMHTPQSALTLASFALVLGYYAVYYWGVIVLSRNAGADLQPLTDKVS